MFKEIHTASPQSNTPKTDRLIPKIMYWELWEHEREVPSVKRDQGRISRGTVILAKTGRESRSEQGVKELGTAFEADRKIIEDLKPSDPVVLASAVLNVAEA